MAKSQHAGPVLVPVDFSQASANALLRAVEIAQCMGWHVLVLHVVHDPGSMPGYYRQALKKKQLLRIEDAASEMLAAFMEKQRANHPRIKDYKRLDSLLIKGLPSSRILEVANKLKSPMIVMGSTGLTGWQHLLIGSIATQVTRLAPMPVMVVKADDKAEDLDHP